MRTRAVQICPEPTKNAKYKLYDMFKVFGETFENEIIDTESTKFPVSIINGSHKFENMSHTFMY